MNNGENIMHGLNILLLCSAVFVAGVLFGMVIMAVCAIAGKNNLDDNSNDNDDTSENKNDTY